MARRDWIGVWELARRERMGLLLQVSDVVKARAELYAARTRAMDPELAPFQIRASPIPEGNLLIVRVEQATQVRNRTLAPAHDGEDFDL